MHSKLVALHLVAGLAIAAPLPMAADEAVAAPADANAQALPLPDFATTVDAATSFLATVFPPSSRFRNRRQVTVPTPDFQDVQSLVDNYAKAVGEALPFKPGQAGAPPPPPPPPAKEKREAQGHNLIKETPLGKALEQLQIIKTPNKRGLADGLPGTGSLLGDLTGDEEEDSDKKSPLSNLPIVKRQVDFPGSNALLGGLTGGLQGKPSGAPAGPEKGSLPLPLPGFGKRSYGAPEPQQASYDPPQPASSYGKAPAPAPQQQTYGAPQAQDPVYPQQQHGSGGYGDPAPQHQQSSYGGSEPQRQQSAYGGGEPQHQQSSYGGGEPQRQTDPYSSGPQTFGSHDTTAIGLSPDIYAEQHSNEPASEYTKTGPGSQVNVAPDAHSHGSGGHGNGGYGQAQPQQQSGYGGSGQQQASPGIFGQGGSGGAPSSFNGGGHEGGSEHGETGFQSGTVDASIDGVTIGSEQGGSEFGSGGGHGEHGSGGPPSSEHGSSGGPGQVEFSNDDESASHQVPKSAFDTEASAAHGSGGPGEHEHDSEQYSDPSPQASAVTIGADPWAAKDTAASGPLGGVTSILGGSKKDTEAQPEEAPIFRSSVPGGEIAFKDETGFEKTETAADAAKKKSDKRDAHRASEPAPSKGVAVTQELTESCTDCTEERERSGHLRGGLDSVTEIASDPLESEGSGTLDKLLGAVHGPLGV